MTKLGEKLIESGHQAVKIASGEEPAARIHINGHVYVPLVEYELLRAAINGAKIAIARDEDTDGEMKALLSV